MTHRTSNGAGALARTALATLALFAGAAQAQTITTVAGNGTQGSAGDGGPATSAQLVSPIGIDVDAAGNRYIADVFACRVRKVTPAGIISTFAGNGTCDGSGDGGQATDAGLAAVYFVDVDASGNVYLAEFNGHRIRKVTPDGVIRTVAGTGIPGSTGDGGQATSAQIENPLDMAFDAAGNLYFTQYGTHQVRKVSPAGVITTVAGTGGRGFSGDGGAATAATFNEPIGIASTPAGVLYVADFQNARVRRIGLDGVVTTVAGNGTLGSSGDGGAATAATLTAWDVEATAGGTLYISDLNSNRVRTISPGGIINAFAGSGIAGYGGDGGPAAAARFNGPTGLALGAGALHIGDYLNYRVRRVDLFTTCAAEGFTGPKLTMCRQVCEVAQTPTRLSGLIRLYTAIYRQDPPCSF